MTYFSIIEIELALNFEYYIAVDTQLPPTLTDQQALTC